MPAGTRTTALAISPATATTSAAEVAVDDPRCIRCFEDKLGALVDETVPADKRAEILAAPHEGVHPPGQVVVRLQADGARRWRAGGQQRASLASRRAPANAASAASAASAWRSTALVAGGRVIIFRPTRRTPEVRKNGNGDDTKEQLGRSTVHDLESPLARNHETRSRVHSKHCSEVPTARA